MHIDPNHLAALSAVLRLGSFDLAAHALHVTPSAISQRIKALEERIGASVVHRGQPCEATPIGARLAKHAEDIGLLHGALMRDLGLERDQTPSRLRIAVNADSLATWFVTAMADVDGILFDLVLDDQDHSAEWLRRGEVSAAVTALQSPIVGCDMHALGALPYIATAHPAFIERWFADGVTAQSIRRAPCLTFNRKDQLQRRWIERNIGEGLVPPEHYLPSSQAFVDAALAGVGWGMNPAPLVVDHLEHGTLQPLIAESSLSVPLSWQVSRVMAPALAPVTKAVLKSARQYL